jgi:RES domain-containing protein
MRPHPQEDIIRKRLSHCLPFLRPFSASVFRTSTPQYANSADLVTGEGARLAGGRWTPLGGFAAVYASLEYETAVEEGFAHFRRYGIPVEQAMPRVIVALQVRLERLLDLTDGTIRRRLGISERRMLGEDWLRIVADDLPSRIGYTRLIRGPSGYTFASFSQG